MAHTFKYINNKKYKRAQYRDMLHNTFLHVPGIGYKFEQLIWKSGICRWEDFLDTSNVQGLPSKLKSKVDEWLILSEEALKRKNIAFFADKLPKNEWWRLYPEFKEETVFLDIETTGLSHYYDDITVIGIFDGKNVKIFIKDQNMNSFNKEFRRFSIVVTFNGTLFDLKFLSLKMKQIKLPPVHIDLKFLLRRLGYNGDLKTIEKTLGILREKDIRDVKGPVATLLWNKYEMGDNYALERLIKYNVADIVNLKLLLEFAYNKMKQQILQGEVDPQYENTTSNFVFEVKAINKHNQLNIYINDRENLTVFPLKNRRRRLTINRILRKLSEKCKENPKVVGIDLSASEKRASGWAVLIGKRAKTLRLKTDKDLVNETIKIKPDLIAIDAPLSLPKGRDCISDLCQCRKFGITRECERKLRRRGIKIFPCLIKSMQPLTERGIKLRKEFESHGFKVIETYPGAAQDILHIIRKKMSVKELQQGVLNFGLKIENDRQFNKFTDDELDAITSALVGYFYLANEHEAIGSESEGQLIIPKKY